MRPEPVDRALLDELDPLLARHGIAASGDRARSSAQRIVMVSTHGYWADPPPAGATDTGGQTLFVLQISKEWARAGRQVVILARWFAPAAQVDALEPGLWLVRIPAGGDGFVRKEALHPLAPALAEYATAVAHRFGAHAVMGHYADGMVIAAEVATRCGIPLVAMPHSLALTKIAGLGLAAGAMATWFDEHYQFGAREEYERAAMAQADIVIGCLPDQLDVVARVYRLPTRREVITPGVAPVFFAAGDAPPDPGVTARFGRYLIVTGRLAETKNIPGAVALLGEARQLSPALRDVRLVVVGGDTASDEPEARAVEAKIEAAMARHGLTSDDVRRVPAQGWPVVAQLLRGALFYVGMQHFEPFGMGAAEALAVGTPVLLSRAAGLARMLDARCAVLVDPADPRAAARRLVDVLDTPAALAQMSTTGRALAREQLSWPHAAARLGALLDDLVDGPAPRPARGHHRLTSAWRGDRPRITSQHAGSAEQLVPRIVEAQRAATGRLIVAIGGESGAGKTEIAHCLGVALRRHQLWVAHVPGDVFFRLPPRANHEARLAADRAGELERYLGPPREIDVAALDAVLAEAADPRTTAIACPSDCRTLGARRYPRVPIELARCEVVIVDLTYAMLLATPALRVFLASDYLERIEHIRRRNTARDPDQDFGFIRKVLAIEHAQIERTAARADLCVDLRGEVRDARRARVSARD